MATAVIDEWTEDKCLQLIREYRARPILWDQKDPFFFKKTLKPVAWQEIGAAINISADQCKHKMIILMSSFRREKAKIMHSMKKGDIDKSLVYKSTWFAFKEMAFLLDKESERKRQLNDTDDSDGEDSNSSSIKLTLLSHHLDTPTHPPKRTRVNEKKEITQKVQHTQPEDTIVQIPHHNQNSGSSQTAAERDDEIKSFTSFIGNKMKKYTDATKNAVQQAICEIIFKADQNYYENNYEKFTIIDEGSDTLNKEIYDRTVIKIQNDSDSG